MNTARSVAGMAQPAFPKMPSLDIYLSAQQVKHRYGGVSDMTLWRWMQDPAFPKPIVIFKRRYWNLGDLQAFERACACSSASTEAA